MKVLMSTSSFLPIIGGAETLIRDITIELNKQNVKTDILTYNMYKKWEPYWKESETYDKGYKIKRIPGFNWFPLTHTDKFTFGVNLIPGRFRNYLSEYDIIHFHGEDMSLPFFSYKVAKPKIFHLHGLNYEFYSRFFINRNILKHISDYYITLSDIMKKDLIALGVKEEKIFKVYNFVDTSYYKPIRFEDKNDNILFVGRITYNKGLHLLLEAIKNISRKLTLDIVGPPGYDNLYYLSMIEEMQKINDQNKHTIRYHGFMDSKKLLKLYQSAALVVLPTFNEAFSLVLIEALATGTPVISTRVGGVPEIVDTYNNGILVDYNNSAQLKESIEFLINNEGERKKYGKNGRKKVIKTFSLKNAIKKLLKIYQAISIDDRKPSI